MTSVLVIAPHPDDETLACAGTLLRHRADGDDIHWLIVTEMREELGYSAAQIVARTEEVAAVAAAYGFASVTQLGLPTSGLDMVPRRELTAAIAEVISETTPETLYLPFSGDAHSDHRIVFAAAAPSAKWFRQPSVKRLYAFEIPSETDFGVDPAKAVFRPNHFVDVSGYVDEKIRILGIYVSETGAFPFPRSEDVVRALAILRGAQAGFSAAEAFMLIKEIR